jgi:hypothetical protein
MPSSRSSAMTSEPSSIPNLRRIRAGTTMVPRFPTRLCNRVYGAGRSQPGQVRQVSGA